jgi:hypothetical protein
MGMKQHITEKQLNELSKEAKEGLSLWWDKRTNVSIEDEQSTCKITYYPDFLKRTPLLSIGQMIEFLDEHRKTILYITKLECGHNNFVWSTGSFSCIGNHTQDKKESKRLHDAGVELCDSLWEAVKEVLNK